MVDDRGTPLLWGFGPTRPRRKEVTRSEAAKPRPHQAYPAPELIGRTGDAHKTQATDVFALAFLFYELAVGSRPLDVKTESDIFNAIRAGQRPVRPARLGFGFLSRRQDDLLWKLLGGMWEHTTAYRLLSSPVAECVSYISQVR